jgi:hypothetical protein
MHSVEQISIGCNVRLSTFDAKTGKLKEQREDHNVLTNAGRTWLRNLCGFADSSAIDGSGYIEGAGNVLTSERAAYMAFGVGGALSAAPYYRTQEELVTVDSLEDFVLYDASNYLVIVENQSSGNKSFPNAHTLRLAVTIPESKVSYVGNTSKSGNVVGTNVPISEVGLYLSGADPTLDPDNSVNKARLVCYNVVAPISVTPNVVFRVEWDLIF